MVLWLLLYISWKFKLLVKRHVSCRFHVDAVKPCIYPYCLVLKVLAGVCKPEPMASTYSGERSSPSQSASPFEHSSYIIVLKATTA